MIPGYRETVPGQIWVRQQGCVQFTVASDGTRMAVMGNATLDSSLGDRSPMVTVSIDGMKHEDRHLIPDYEVLILSALQKLIA